MSWIGTLEYQSWMGVAAIVAIALLATEVKVRWGKQLEERADWVGEYILAPVMCVVIVAFIFSFVVYLHYHAAYADNPASACCVIGSVALDVCIYKTFRESQISD